MITNDLNQAVSHMAAALYELDTGDVFGAFTCTEIESIASVLVASGYSDVAAFVLAQHAQGDLASDLDSGDCDCDDMHHTFTWVCSGNLEIDDHTDERRSWDECLDRARAYITEALS